MPRIEDVITACGRCGRLMAWREVIVSLDPRTKKPVIKRLWCCPAFALGDTYPHSYRDAAGH